MVRIVFFLLSVIGFNSGYTQQKIPSFRLTMSNGKFFNASELPLGKPVIVVYFSPECDHCQDLMKEWFKKSAEFKKASVVMITFLPISNLALFESEFKTKRHSNTFVGTEGTSFYVRNYYKVTDMPFVALHDKNGNLIITYSKKIPLKSLSLKLQQLK